MLMADQKEIQDLNEQLVTVLVTEYISSARHYFDQFSLYESKSLCNFADIEYN